MTEPGQPFEDEQLWDTAYHLHDLLLRLAGWLPDDELRAARSALAAGREEAVVDLLVFAGMRTLLPLTDHDVEVLAAILADDGGDAGLLGQVALAAEDALPPWWFTEPSAEAGPPDRGLVEVLTGEPGVRGIWRAVRLPDPAAEYPPPRTVHVVELDEKTPGCRPPFVLAEELQQLLLATGEPEPRVEVVSIHTQPSYYQREAREIGELMWAPEGAGDVTVARIFDLVDPELGPAFAEDHPRITDDGLRDRLLGYLDTGPELLATTGRLPDVVEPGRGEVVPMTFRTDGRWVWTDTVSYYLREYGIAPDPRLTQHIEEGAGVPARPDTVTLRRVWDAVTADQPADEVWTYS